MSAAKSVMDSPSSNNRAANICHRIDRGQKRIGFLFGLIASGMSVYGNPGRKGILD
jgi:hypothetical protein